VISARARHWSKIAFAPVGNGGGVTLKTGLGFVQGHWEWHHLIDRIRVPIRLP